ncbi:zinc metalloproteinase-disintegrin-like VLAIP-B isoform X2 [Ambystoma mexicanum]|uniref:zinc metalloproteinase-disintegrin-like VLAIP-B isoform X2 n=1 Tax=Ambystoma mexicanum TaxID=8296 RepID=UPI0037E9A261
MLTFVLASAVLLSVQQRVSALAYLPGVKEYEVVYLQKMYSRHRRDTQAKYPDEVQFGFKVQGEDVVLHLERNENLLAQNYTQTHYLPNGQEVTTSPSVSDHCYYHGSVHNDSDSEASISLCTGVSGYFRTRGQRYLIEPLKLAEGDAHAVYKYESLEETPKMCGVTNTTWEGGPAKTSRSRSSTSTQKQEFLNAKKYVELYVVADNSIFKKYNRSKEEVQARIFEIVNYVNLVYKSIKVFVALIGIEIWDTEDLFVVNTSAGEDLDKFSSWRSKVLLKKKKNDNAQFLTNIDFDGPTVGLAFVGTMCSTDHSSGVIQDHSRLSISVGATMAHEMGHNLGMTHDTGTCTCPDKSCIMAASLSYTTPKSFSTCSHQNFQDFILTKMPECMRVEPAVQDLIAPSVCGNGFTETGEQCDCGTAEECQNPCCEAATCRFKDGAKCADGACCANCQIRGIEVVCRPSKDDCDLPDHCDGTSAQCPRDRFRVNGFPCLNGIGYCLNGTCPTLQNQCTDLWGAAAVTGADSCFQINRRGVYYGFCKYTDSKYVACAAKDVKCGKLYCTGGSDTPSIYANSAMLGTCKALSPPSAGMELIGMTPTGTKCGDKMVCSSGECLDMESIFRSANCSSKCKGHAVCDNELMCQCEEGWAPPNCDNASGQNITIIVVVVVVIAITILVVIVLLWYRGTFKNKAQRTQPTTVSGVNNPGFEKKRNPPVIVHTPEMNSSEGRHVQTRVGYSSPQYVVASPSPEPINRPLYGNAKPMKPNTPPPPIPVAKAAAPKALSSFGSQLNTPPSVPMGKPVMPKQPPVVPPPPPQALKPPTSRTKI